MQFYPDVYYHLYNRSNNKERLFKEDENYTYFLKQYQKRFQHRLDTIAYCLMPTHFHFLVMNKEDSEGRISHQIGIWLSAYTKAINNRYQRNGCLFQRHTKSIPVDDEKYLLNLVSYIHQNPVRSGLVDRLEEWQYSSYIDYIGFRNGSMLKKDIINSLFRNVDEFKAYSEELILEINQKYWI